MNNKFVKYLSIVIGISLSGQTGFSAMNQYNPFVNMAMNNNLSASMNSMVQLPMNMFPNNMIMDNNTVNLSMNNTTMQLPINMFSSVNNNMNAMSQIQNNNPMFYNNFMNSNTTYNTNNNQINDNISNSFSDEIGKTLSNVSYNVNSKYERSLVSKIDQCSRNIAEKFDGFTQKYPSSDPNYNNTLNNIQKQFINFVTDLLKLIKH